MVEPNIDLKSSSIPLLYLVVSCLSETRIKINLHFKIVQPTVLNAGSSGSAIKISFHYTFVILQYYRPVLLKNWKSRKLSYFNLSLSIFS